MWKISRLRLLCSCAGILALAGCSQSENADAAKAKAEAEAANAEVANVKSELAQVKSELSQVQGELAKSQAVPEARGLPGGRYQLVMNSKEQPAYLVDAGSGQVWKANLATAIWEHVMSPAPK